jgi:hypothetical protein
VDESVEGCKGSVEESMEGWKRGNTVANVVVGNFRRRKAIRFDSIRFDSIRFDSIGYQTNEE